ncbi:hypothetical protein [Leucobacter luti]|uniref:LPXTG-motif cell wall-anchored protein n=1 Tax=Leucobacter luti TaxID=340320 RepID=A0A4Q7TKI5_9MICO|nr:hypothetical protein [Leucobacter luti]MBL3700186.1 hypothetical protein [Leucobacter luti]RZT61091.1 hypothetical protein EV139_2840 [Leucobacter luti]
MNVVPPLFAVALSVASLISPVAPVSGAPASAAHGPLDLPEQRVIVEMPAPGESASTELSVVNVSASAVPLTVSVPEFSGVATEGTTPVTIRVLDASGAELLSSQRSLHGSAAPLGDLASGKRATVTIEATLPITAENAYQATDAEAVVRFSTTVDGGTTPPTSIISQLAQTGAAWPLAALFATGAVVAGVLLTARARRKNRTA